MIGYFAKIGAGRVVLWCYLWWYLVTVYFHFDPSPRIWANSLGISLIVGIALLLSVAKLPTSPGGQSPPAGPTRGVDRWQTFRLFLMPFCVSSFSSLIKNQEFLLVIPPRPIERLVSIGACAAFVTFVLLVKWNARRNADRHRPDAV